MRLNQPIRWVSSLGISDLQFTGRYRVPFQYSAYLCSSTCPSGLSWQSAQGIGLTGPGRQRLHRPHRLLRRERVRGGLLQGLHGRGRTHRRGAGAGAGRLPPLCGRHRRALAAPVGAGGGELSHVGHRGGDAGGAPGALPHRQTPPGALSPGRTTAGGKTCSPAQATRCPRAKPTRWPT
jgi:hypothetical protein